jgi:hypothetical protein
VRSYGAQFIQEYVDATVGAAQLNVGEVWTGERRGRRGGLTWQEGRADVAGGEG